jgi:hypothetical protein
MATCPLDRRNQILLTSQSPLLLAVQQEGQHFSPQSPEYQAPLPELYTKGITPELLPSRLNFLLLLYLFFFLNFLLFVLFTLTSLFSYSYSYPFHFPSFCCATIHCSPSQLLFLPLLIHAFPLSLSHHPSSTCYHTIPPSYTITTH